MTAKLNLESKDGVMPFLPKALIVSRIIGSIIVCYNTHTVLRRAICTWYEIEEALGDLSKEAPGLHGIAPELLKYGGSDDSKVREGARCMF